MFACSKLIMRRRKTGNARRSFSGSAWRPYLTREAVAATLDSIARVPESEVVFDYAEPFENYPAGRSEHVMAVAARAAALGEPWLSLFDPADLSGMLREKGFATIEDLGLVEISDRFYGALQQGISIGAGPHVVRAQRTRSAPTGAKPSAVTQLDQ
jgi:O-methyltransferase involved in polyketide biosynthesis